MQKICWVHNIPHREIPLLLSIYLSLSSLLKQLPFSISHPFPSLLPISPNLPSSSFCFIYKISFFVPFLLLNYPLSTPISFPLLSHVYTSFRPLWFFSNIYQISFAFRFSYRISYILSPVFFPPHLFDIQCLLLKILLSYVFLSTIASSHFQVSSALVSPSFHLSPSLSYI